MSGRRRVPDHVTQHQPDHRSPGQVVGERRLAEQRRATAGPRSGPGTSSCAHASRATATSSTDPPPPPAASGSPIVASPISPTADQISSNVAPGSSSAARTASRPRTPAAHLRRLAASSTCSSEMPIDMRPLPKTRTCSTFYALARARHHRHARRPARARAGREGLHARRRGAPAAPGRPRAAARRDRRSRSAPTAASPRSTSARRRARSAARSSPSTTTAAPRRTRPAGSTTTPSLVDAEFGLMDTLPVFRRTIARRRAGGPGRRRRREVHDRLRALAHAPVAAVHRRRPRRGARPERLHAAGRAG